MKKIEYLSPSAIAKYKFSVEEFYLRYLCNDRPDDDPQTQPMAVGSAFDAYAKSYLHEKLFGKGNDPRFDFQTLFEAQVQSHNRDYALIAGKHCFNEYQKCGALSDLLLELQHAVNKPRFEIEVKGVVEGYREGIAKEFQGVTFLGKPDLFFINKSGMSVILDWKVNGYCSKYPKSPMEGYVRLRNDPKKNGHHSGASLLMHGGTMINNAVYLEDLEDQWATQLSIYAWLCGGAPGGDFIAAIDQLCCSPSSIPGTPSIRVAEHRLRISRDYQNKVFNLAQEIWILCHSDHFFRDMTKEDSQARCSLLDSEAEALRGTGSEQDRIFMEITRPR